MPDLFTRERLERIKDSIVVLQQYMSKIQSIVDMGSPPCAIAHDALLMRLHVIGENLKVLLQVNPCLFNSMKFEVSYIVSFRDMSHIYKESAPEIVFDICTQYIPLLKDKVEAILRHE